MVLPNSLLSFSFKEAAGQAPARHHSERVWYGLQKESRDFMKSHFKYYDKIDKRRARVSNMVRKSPSPRGLSPKLRGSFLPKSDFETFGHTGRATEGFLATWFFSGIF